MRRVVRGRRVVLPDGERPASIHIADGRISAVSAYNDTPTDVDLVEAGDLVVSPGLVDSHVHINEPGRTDWEGFETATRAAAAGGITTIVDMPLNSIPATTTVAGLEAKRTAARGRCHVDVAFWGGIVPGNEAEIAPLVQGGVRGFKCFLTPSGVDEFPNVDEAALRRALPVLAAAGGRSYPLLVHAEDPAALLSHEGDRRSYRAYLATRPAVAEVRAIELIAALAREFGITAHIVHVSSAAGVTAISQAIGKGTALTAETCPHYLALTATEIADGATPFKCAPPIREAGDREALWRSLETGVLQAVVTDHSPSPPSMKCLESGDFMSAWGGIASLQLALPVVWSNARGRGFGPADVARWMCAAPARLAGLSGRKGEIVEGADADLVLWDPEAAWTAAGASLQHRYALTPYEGRRLRGVVAATYLRGEAVWREGAFAPSPTGTLL